MSQQSNYYPVGSSPNPKEHRFEHYWFDLMDFLLKLGCLTEKTHQDTYFDEDYMGDNYN